MRGEELLASAAARAGELPGTELAYPFGAGWEVWKVRGKVFLLLTEATGEPLVNLKADPLDGEALRAAYPEISAGYHMNKKHWITVRSGDLVAEELLWSLVTESYLLVVEKLPKRLRPVDPYAFDEDRRGWEPGEHPR